MRLGTLVVEFQAHGKWPQLARVEMQLHVLVAALRQAHHLLAQLLLPGGAGHRRLQGERGGGAGRAGLAAGGAGGAHHAGVLRTAFLVSAEARVQACPLQGAVQGLGVGGPGGHRRLGLAGGGGDRAQGVAGGAVSGQGGNVRRFVERVRRVHHRKRLRRVLRGGGGQRCGHGQAAGHRVSGAVVRGVLDQIPDRVFAAYAGVGQVSQRGLLSGQRVAVTGFEPAAGQRFQGVAQGVAGFAGERAVAAGVEQRQGGFVGGAVLLGRGQQFRRRTPQGAGEGLAVGGRRLPGGAGLGEVLAKQGGDIHGLSSRQSRRTRRAIALLVNSSLSRSSRRCSWRRCCSARRAARVS